MGIGRSGRGRIPPAGYEVEWTNDGKVVMGVHSSNNFLLRAKYGVTIMQVSYNLPRYCISLNTE